MLATSAFGDEGAAAQVAALVSGGAVAVEFHTLKASANSAINMCPEPFSKWITSLGEDAVAVSAIIFAGKCPYWFLFVLGVALLTGAMILHFLWRFVSTLVAQTATLDGCRV